jgi:hypothetical protein
MVTVFEVLYVPPPGLKVGVAVIFPDDEPLVPHPAASIASRAPAQTADHTLTLFNIPRQQPFWLPELSGCNEEHPSTHVLMTVGTGHSQQ